MTTERGRFAGLGHNSVLALPPEFAIFGLMGISIEMAGRKGEDDNGTGTGVGVVTRTQAKTKKPTPYKVLMLNDDYTPMEFVVHVLQNFFKMSMEDATRVMLQVHQKGVGVCGVFTYEVAETKVNQVIDFARQNQHPLQCTLEKA
jgi:ATP-dependent Clp protease adaptor protein ClpS